MVYCEADPPSKCSVVYSAGRWTVGSSMFIEEVRMTLPSDTITSWKDGQRWLCLRPLPSVLTSVPPGDWKTALIDRGIASSAVFQIGHDTFIKCHQHIEGLQLEGSTTEFVRRHEPSIPVPIIIHEWIDEPWARSFSIMRRAPGVQLDRVWDQLSSTQIRSVVQEIAGHLHKLSLHTSKYIEMVDGHGVNWSGMLWDMGIDWLWPVWKPKPTVRFNAESLRENLVRFSGVEPPDPEGDFCLSNLDVNPQNIFVHLPTEAGGIATGKEGAEEEGNVRLAMIIDWEATMYVPRYFIRVNAKESAINAVIGPRIISDGTSFGDVLGEELGKLGFACDLEWFKRHNEGLYKYYDEIRPGVEKRRLELVANGETIYDY